MSATGATAGVVLAAGAGRRFGGVKQLARYDGEPLVRRACRTALAAGLSPVIVVLGAHADSVAAAIAELPVELLHNPRWADGMGTSVACAAAALLPRPAVDDLALLLADQPDVTAEHVRDLCALRRRTASAVAATDAGVAIGPPAVFARDLFAALTALGGDRGARELIAATAARVVLPFAPAAHDIDVAADLSCACR